ncbi:MAG: Ppx/GppA family phosphatase [Gemmatimonadales bacterium]|nr:MAG: Ppx/GppA family phosphatase [Gemmatimonadales bacterium]
MSHTPPFAVVDTGSNAIRFLVARLGPSGQLEELDSLRAPVRLGHQVFLRGRLAPEAMDAAVRAFVGFRERMDALGVERIQAVATSAVREARNGDLLVRRIRREAGIDLEIITGTEEARLVHRAVASRIDLTGRQWILVDLGGGSVEVSLVDDQGMLWSESHTMGSVRLLEEVAEGTRDPGRIRTLLEEYVSILRIPSPAQYWTPGGFVATGGNIEALVKLAGASPDESGTSRLATRDLDGLIQLLARLSWRERIRQLDLREDRADVILPAALVYYRLARESGAGEILVPHVGLKEGLLLDLAERVTRPEGRAVRVADDLRRSAISLGRRFMFDEAHGVQTARLALLLFDRLRDLHGLEDRDRQLLEVAALLHDVGLFIGFRKHHKHSLYILSRSELPGLGPEENLLVANVARYHRKSHPRDHHSEYMRQSPANRLRTDQLAALLRIADAMDRQHLQRVKELHIRVEGLRIFLKPEGEGDLLLERWALSKKKSLFEETFGFTVEVDAEHE